MDYKNAGVDIEAGYKSVELMKEHIKKTMRLKSSGDLVDFPVLSHWRRSRRWKSLYYCPVQTDVEPR